MIILAPIFALLIPILAICVTLIITIVKLGRNTVSKKDLDDTIESLRSNINNRFEEVNRRLDEAAVDRKRIEAEAVSDRDKIRQAMSEGFAQATADRKRIEAEAAADRDKIRQAMSEGFAQAAADRKDMKDEASTERKRIEEAATADRKEIKREIIRQNQNYIEHLAHHKPQKSNPVSEEDDST